MDFCSAPGFSELPLGQRFMHKGFILPAFLTSLHLKVLACLLINGPSGLKYTLPMSGTLRIIFSRRRKYRKLPNVHNIINGKLLYNISSKRFRIGVVRSGEFNRRITV